MNRYDNPFHDLWVTEILGPTQFVTMFSPVVAQQAEELFGTGNVIIKGRQGSGKSMLLGLLNTTTRVAYARSGQEYPAPSKYKSFITAGIHLIRDNTRIVASRLTELPENKRKVWAATTFADYVNYLLVQDLLVNVIYLATEQQRDGVLCEEIRTDWNTANQSKLLALLKDSDAWFGYLDTCQTMDDVVQRVSHRLKSYRSFFNFNSDILDREVESSKTDIGEPVAILADALRKSNVIPENTLVFLKIDQHEELYEIERSSSMESIFRQVINRALAMRDGRVSYRVGTRHYAWNSDVKVWGTGAKLESMRDFVPINIDEILKRHENSSTGIKFEDFAADVFKRRLSAYRLAVDSYTGKELLRKVFGKTMLPRERAKQYVKDKGFLLRIPSDWSPEWRGVLPELWEKDPLDAKLCEVWLKQRNQQKVGVHLSHNPTDFDGWRRPYWQKERNEAALVQIAGDAREMLIWSGSRHIVDLAGWNILAFMTLCRSIWSAWIRSASDEQLEHTEIPEVGLNQQVIGITEASRIWSEKLREGSASDKRYTFITALGAYLSKSLREDRALSYPGHTGFSLTCAEFETPHPLNDLIKICQDQGDLVGSPHTTKSKNGLPRVKWYINPLLCPHFRIPHIRTKEPLYITLKQLEEIAMGAGFETNTNSSALDVSPIQRDLF